ncbi:UNVERIFIED_CONTAM: hypothetical protein FKN15_025890 [Acipenser sinensis]
MMHWKHADDRLSQTLRAEEVCNTILARILNTTVSKGDDSFPDNVISFVNCTRTES